MGFQGKNISLLGQNFHLKGMLQNILKQLLRHKFTAIIANKRLYKFQLICFLLEFLHVIFNSLIIFGLISGIFK